MNIVFQIISIAVIAFSAALIIWRILPNAGIELKRSIGIKTDGGYTPSAKECMSVFLYILLFHVFMVFAGYLIYCLFNGGDSASVSISNIANVWKRWDADHYLNISKSYTEYIENGDYTTLVFFPMYPWLVKIISIIIPHRLTAALVVSGLCASAAGMFLYKLVCIDYPKSAAQKTVILMCVFPFAFFQQAIMSESVFLLTSVMTLYYVRKHNWIAAGIAGALAALSRSVGVFLIFPATVEFIEEYKLLSDLRNIKPKLILIAKKWAWLLLLPIGTCIYLLINYKITGNPLYFLKMEEKYWFQTTQPFFKTVGGLWNIITGGYDMSTQMSAFIPGLIILLSMYALMILGVRKQRSMYSTWLLVYIIVNTTMSWPLSLSRYLSCAVPAFMTLGSICDRNKKANAAFTIGFSILFGIYLTAYLTGKQVM